jgi:hypothetical protein
MSITVISSLPSLLPVGNSDVVVVSSNNTASANFRYVCDVSGSLSSARLKCDKLPTTSNGFFGVSKVVETLITPQVPQLTSGWQNGGYAVNANLTFREEFGTPPTVATGGTASAPLIAWQAAFRQQDYASYSPSAYIAATVSGDTPAIKTFSNRPLTATLASSESDFIGVLSNVSGIALRVNYNGGASRSAFLVTGSTSAISNIINAGPYGLYNLTSSQCSDGSAGSVNFPTDGQNIAVLVTFNTAGNITSAFSRTAAYFYTIDNCQRYNNFRVFFRNMYGGVDGYTFTRMNRQRVDVDRKTYGYNASVYGDDVYDKQWSVTYRDTYTLNSDWLTDAEFSWLQEMIYAPECWVQIGTQLVPVVVQTNTYNVRKRVVDKLQQISVDVQVGYENTAL